MIAAEAEPLFDLKRDLSGFKTIEPDTRQCGLGTVFIRTEFPLQVIGNNVSNCLARCGLYFTRVEFGKCSWRRKCVLPGSKESMVRHERWLFAAVRGVPFFEPLIQHIANGFRAFPRPKCLNEHVDPSPRGK